MATTPRSSSIQVYLDQNAKVIALLKAKLAAKLAARRATKTSKETNRVPLRS